VHIDRVLDFEASGSEKERTENIHCFGINLKAEREWARLGREKAIGQQEDEEEEEEEVQWHIRRRTAGASHTLLLPSSSATRQPVMVPRIQTLPPPSLLPTESDRQFLTTPPPSSSSGTRQAVAQAERARERGAAALLRRAARAAKAAEPAEGPDTGWLDSWTNMGVAIYGKSNQLLVPGHKQGIVTEEDPAAVADGAAEADVGADGADFAAANEHSMQSIRDHQRSSHGLLEGLTGHLASSSRGTNRVRASGERPKGAFPQHWTGLPRHALRPHYHHV
jgi:hypothetical protein